MSVLIALGFVFCSLFFGYPLFIWLLSRIEEHRAHRKTALTKDDPAFIPPVSMIIPTVAGGDIMTMKLKNILTLNYPLDKLEVIVIDSSDKPFKAPIGVKVIHQERLGKPAALNLGIEASANDIIVITDDDAVLDSDILAHLVPYFSDPKVGGVVGDLTLGRNCALGKMNSSFYSIFRNSLRRWESTLDSVSFTSGELFAFRKSIVSKIDVDVLSDDLYLLFEIRKRGYRILASEAKVYEEDVSTLRGQINHKRRTMIGTLQVFSRNLRMLFNSKHGFFGTLIAPSYLLRITLCPVLLLALEVLLLLELPILLFLILVFLLISTILKRDLASALVYGIIVQASAILGTLDFILGNYGVGWKKKGK